MRSILSGTTVIRVYFSVTWHKSNMRESVLMLVGSVPVKGDCSRVDTSSMEASTLLRSLTFSFLWTPSSRPSALFTWRRS